jgi:hypothetical protein
MTDGITVIEKDSQEKNKYMYRQKRLKRILDVRRERE